MSGPVTEGEPTGGARKRPLVTFWRVVAVLALGLAGYALFGARDTGPKGPHIAVHEIFGVIFVDDARNAVLREIADDPEAAALILRIDSPGGTTTGAEALFEAIRAVAGEKPVVAVMGEVAASGGYIAAVGADHVLAYGNTLTGSIGVVTQQPDLSGLLASLGIEMRENRSDVFKAAPSPFGPVPPEVADWEDELIADAYGWFRGLVADRRGLSGAALDRVADGREFTGRQALDLGLIDGLGGLDAARDWLDGQGVDADLPLRLREVPKDRPNLLLDLLTSRLGIDAEALRLRQGVGVRLYSILR